MKSLIRISIALVAVLGLASVALAGDTPPPAPSKPAPTAPVVDKKKAPEPVKPAPAPTPTPTADKPAPAMEMPKPPAELAAAFKAMSGTWRCLGTAMDPGKGEVQTKGTMKHKMDLDNWWIVSSFVEAKKGGYKYTSMSSFDGNSKKWSRTMFDNMGGRETAESSGMADGKMTWDGSSTSMMGTMKSRHFEEVKGPREAHIWGEYSADGKQWMKAYDVTCKK